MSAGVWRLKGEIPYLSFVLFNMLSTNHIVSKLLLMVFRTELNMKIVVF